MYLIIVQFLIERRSLMMQPPQLAMKRNTTETKYYHAHDVLRGVGAEHALELGVARVAQLVQPLGKCLMQLAKPLEEALGQLRRI